jgi:hypothetical protein
MSDGPLFEAVCERLVPRIIMKTGILRDECLGNAAFPNPPSAFGFLDVKLDPGTVDVVWGSNQAVMRKNATGGGYHSFLYTGVREDVAANEHETLDSMIQQACSFEWNE